MSDKYDTELYAMEHTPILLLCDFTDINNDLLKLSSCAAFLPLCNILLVQHALDTIIHQGFENIFFCLKSKENKCKILEMANALYLNKITPRFIVSPDYGSLMRIVDEYDYGFDTFVIFPVNFITNVSLREMINKYYEMRRMDRKVIVNLHLFANDNYSNEIDIYCLKEYKDTHEVLYYERTSVKDKISPKLLECVKKHEDMTILSRSVKPRFMVAGKEVFALFSENYDYNNMDDLIASTMRMNFYEYRFIAHFEEETFKNENFDREKNTEFSNYPGNTDLEYLDRIETNNNYDGAEKSDIERDFSLLVFENSDNIVDKVEDNSSNAYSTPSPHHIFTVIINLSDYYDLNYKFKDHFASRNKNAGIEFYYNGIIYTYDMVGSNYVAECDLKSGTAINNSELNDTVNRNIGFNDILNHDTGFHDTVLGCGINLKSDILVANSIVYSGVEIFQEALNKIIFDDIIISKTAEKYVVHKNNKIIIEYSPETYEYEVYTDTDSISSSGILTFHIEIYNYLNEIVSDVISQKLQIQDVRQQVNLIAIVWKANSRDFADAFTIFVADLIDPEDLNQSTINASFFFPLVQGIIRGEEQQQEFVKAVYDNLRFKNKRMRKEAFIRIGYALMDDGIVDKDVLNSSRIIKGNFFK